jgi:diguanylate cyclase (GGDEF)-like protein/PAS domain S-box-containing protein
MPTIRLLLAEDSESDADLELRALKRAGLQVDSLVVETEPAFRRALHDFAPEVIVSDFSMPHFDGISALRIAREIVPDTPFLFVSGTIGEEHAIHALREGATDYVLKNNLARFPAAVQRALEEARGRRERRRAQAGLSRAQAMAKLAHIVTSEDGAFVSWSENLPALIGVAAEAMARTTREWLELIHPDDRHAFRRISIESGASGERAEVAYRVRRGSEWIHLRQVMEPMRDQPGPGGAPEWFSTLQDVTEQKRAEDKLARLSRLYHVASETNAVIIRARERGELYREACRIAVEVGRFRLAWLGVVDEAAGGIAVVASQGATPEYIAAMPKRLEVAAHAGEGLGSRAVREVRPMIANDIEHDARIQLRKEALANGLRSLVILPLVAAERVEAVLALYADVPGFFDQEEMKSLLDLAGDISFALESIGKQERLDHLAYFDPLTGLANASLFRERLAQQVAAASGKLSLLILDVARFKSVNDALGRQAGDRLLKEIGQRLRAGQDAGRVARIGADRFALLVPQGEDEAARVAEQRLAECFGAPYRPLDAELHLSARVGIAVFPADGRDADTLLANAEAALKKAKSGGEKFLFYNQEMSERTHEVLSLESQLRQALERAELLLHYQPKVDLATRAIVGVEALMRWQHPTRGLVPPLKFIPILEENGMIVEAGLWAIGQAARDHRRWRELGLKAPRIAVNVSAVQLRRRDFVARLQQALGADAQSAGVDLEITESLLMDDIEATIQKLKAARELGLAIAIDDFGTGYSSLAYLSRLPVSTLKIDRSFVQRMLQDADATSIVQTIIGLAHSLRLDVVAEGVEAEDQANVLRLLRCDQMQGYLFSKPVPAADLEKLLKAQ